MALLNYMGMERSRSPLFLAPQFAGPLDTSGVRDALAKQADAKIKLMEKIRSDTPDLSKYHELLAKAKVLPGNKRDLNDQLKSITGNIAQGIKSVGGLATVYVNSDQYKADVASLNALINNIATAEHTYTDHEKYSDLIREKQAVDQYAMGPDGEVLEIDGTPLSKQQYANYIAHSTFKDKSGRFLPVNFDNRYGDMKDFMSEANTFFDKVGHTSDGRTYFDMGGTLDYGLGNEYNILTKTDTKTKTNRAQLNQAARNLLENGGFSEQAKHGIRQLFETKVRSGELERDDYGSFVRDLIVGIKNQHIVDETDINQNISSLGKRESGGFGDDINSPAGYLKRLYEADQSIVQHPEVPTTVYYKGSDGSWNNSQFDFGGATPIDPVAGAPLVAALKGKQASEITTTGIFNGMPMTQKTLKDIKVTQVHSVEYHPQLRIGPDGNPMALTQRDITILESFQKEADPHKNDPARYAQIYDKYKSKYGMVDVIPYFVVSGVVPESTIDDSVKGLTFKKGKDGRQYMSEEDIRAGFWDNYDNSMGSIEDAGEEEDKFFGKDYATITFRVEGSRSMPMGDSQSHNYIKQTNALAAERMRNLQKQNDFTSKAIEQNILR